MDAQHGDEPTTPRIAAAAADQSGQTLMEYALLLVLIAVACFAVVQAIGIDIAGFLSGITSSL